MTRIRNVRNSTKFTRSVNAISPVIATLLMIAIAVVASLVVYAWVSGYMGFQTEKTGNAIALPSFTVNDDADMVVYVQNVGQGAVQVGAVYVDGEQVADFSTDTSKQLAEGDTVDLLIDDKTYDSNTRYDIKVTTTDGTFMTATGKSGSGGTTPSTNPALLDPTVPAPTLSETTIAPGESITADVTISGLGATPTGTVTFQYSTGGAWTDISVETLSGGSATSDSFQPATEDTYSIRVVYLGDSNYNGATSNSATLTVESTEATQLVFTVHPSQITAGVNTLFTIERQTASGNPTTEGGAITIALDDEDVANANFYAHEGDTFPNVIYSITMPAGSSSVNVYYGYWVQNPLPADLTFTASSTGLTPATADVHVVEP